MRKRPSPSSFGELLKGDLYQEEAIYNMTALYYTVVADVMRATFNASVNNDIPMFLTSTKDFLDVCTPIFTRRKAEGELSVYLKKIEEAKNALAELKSNPAISPNQKEDAINDITTMISDTRRGVLRLITPILLTTDRALTKWGKAEDAMGELPDESE